MADNAAAEDFGALGGNGGVSNMKKRFEQLAATPPTPAKPSSLSLPRSNGGGRPTAGRERALSSDCGRSSGLEEEGGGGAQEAGGGPARPGVVRKRSSSGPPSRMEQPKEVPKDEEQRTLHGWRSQVNLKIAPDLPSSTSKPPFSSSRQSSFASTTKPSPNPAVPKLAVKPSPPPVPPLATRPASVSTSTSSYRKAPAPPTPRKVIAPAIPQEGSDAAQKEVLARPEPLASVGSVKLLAAKLMAESRPPSRSSTPPLSAPPTASSPELSPPPAHPPTARQDLDVPNRNGAMSLRPSSALLGTFDGDDEIDPFSQAVATADITRPGTGSPESFDSPPPPPPPLSRPVVPPRPIQAVREPTPTPYRPPPPPVPSRASTSPGYTSPPQPVLPISASSSPTLVSSTSFPSLATAAPPSSAILPPPKRGVAPPSVVRSASPFFATPTPTPVRPSVPYIAPPSTTFAQAPYLPPPPPSRAIAPNERLAPLRPTLAEKTPVGSGEESSSDEEDDAFSRSQEFPDATFANRRPPTLRNRRPLHPQSNFSAFAVRGKVVVTGQHNISLHHHSGSSESVALPGENKVQAVEFRSAVDPRFVWAGSKEGHVFETDSSELRVANVRTNIHAHPITNIFRVGHSMVTLDDSGKLLTWGSFDTPGLAILSSTPKVQRIADKQTFAAMIGNELWTSSGPIVKSGASVLAGRSPQIRVYDPTGAGPLGVTPRAVTTPESAGHIGAVTASAVVSSQDHLVYLGHDNGYVSVWSRSTYTCVLVQRVSPYMITSMAGVGQYLWVGFRTGFIYIYDVEVEPWMVRKAWKAHKEAVTKISVDSSTLRLDEILLVASSGLDMVIHFWDGLLRDDWLDAELQLRQPEYCTFRTIRSLHISWNIDASKPSDLVGPAANFEFLHQCLTSVDSPDMISFGFQEMIDLENKGLTAKTMLLGKKKPEQKFADGVSSSYRLWHDKLVQAVRLTMPPDSPYTVVHVGDMVGLFSCVFVKSAERDALRDVALITVKTGMKGRYGNKGAILSRFVIDDTSICLINVHLAAGQAHRRQRDQDLVDILEDKSAFSDLATSSPGAYAVGGGGTTVFDHELCFLSGDLNYRIDQRRDLVLAAVAEGNYASLLPHDQLLKGLAMNASFRLRSFREALITFAPTYKYDPGTDNYDGSAKRRIPAWCDRVLYRADRPDKIKPLHYQRYECNVSDHRPISAAFDLQIKSIVPEKRSTVWLEVEQAWFGVERELLKKACEFYGVA